MVYRSSDDPKNAAQPVEAPISPAPMTTANTTIVDDNLTDADDPTPVTGPPAGTPEPALVPGNSNSNSGEKRRRTSAGRAKVPSNRN